MLEDINVVETTQNDFISTQAEEVIDDSKVVEYEKEGVTKVISEEEVMIINDGEDERVICVNTGEIFADNKEAGEKMDVSAGSIKRCCNGDTKSAGKDKDGNKLVWKYVRDL